MASTEFKAISQVADILNRLDIDRKDGHFILDLITKTLGENIQLQESLIKKDCEIEDLQSIIYDQGDHTMRAYGNKEKIEQLEEKIKGLNENGQQMAKQLKEKDENLEDYKETWQRQFQQLKENRLLLENLEASIEYLQEQVKEKDEEIIRLKEKNLGNMKSKKYVECKHDDETIYYYPVTKDN